jgi:hypothetical protein
MIFPWPRVRIFSTLSSIDGIAKFTVVISDDTSSESGASDEFETTCKNNVRDSDYDIPNLQETTPEMSMDSLEIYMSYKFARTF